jgi:hypothetical protein
MKKLEKCQHCGEQKENCYHGFIAMCLPIQKQKLKLISGVERIGLRI